MKKFAQVEAELAENSAIQAEIQEARTGYQIGDYLTLDEYIAHQSETALCSHRVIVPKSVHKQLDSLPANVRNRVIERLLLLAENPQPRGVIKLKGYEDEYRIRIGD